MEQRQEAYYQIKDTSDRTSYTVELELEMFYTLFDQPTHTMAGNS